MLGVLGSRPTGLRTRANGEVSTILNGRTIGGMPRICPCTLLTPPRLAAAAKTSAEDVTRLTATRGPRHHVSPRSANGEPAFPAWLSREFYPTKPRRLRIHLNCDSLSELRWPFAAPSGVATGAGAACPGITEGALRLTGLREDQAQCQEGQPQWKGFVHR
jgi:hypothetical protein